MRANETHFNHRASRVIARCSGYSIVSLCRARRETSDNCYAKKKIIYHWTGYSIVQIEINYRYRITCNFSSTVSFLRSKSLICFSACQRERIKDLPRFYIIFTRLLHNKRTRSAAARFAIGVTVPRSISRNCHENLDSVPTAPRAVY